MCFKLLKQSGLINQQQSLLRLVNWLMMILSMCIRRRDTVDREIFAFKYFRVINVRVSNFRHKVQDVKIIHGVFYFRVLNFRRP